ncbi:MAG: HAD family hydrolase [Candidatus Bathyarchaeota archaeon]|nr:HAD family hydrolase [Candidatus Bathyarchaeota archaeon]MDH5787187.1 HAD family hydrolase [Candidatus Bathyarchaeota archaeon]
MTIKAVLFDMGNTLVKYDYGLPEEVFRKVLFSLGISRSLDDMKKAFVNAEKEAEDNKLLESMGKIKRAEFWHQWDSLVMKHLEIAEHEELAKSFTHSKWMEFVDSRLYPEVKEVLLELKRRGLKVGLISNGYEEEIILVLKKANLERTTFDIIVGVDTIKKVKPNPDIFRYAISKLDVKPEETIFVGDNSEVDYKGAENSGIHALLIDRTEKQQSDLRTIKNLKELLSLKLTDFFHKS